MAKLHYSLSLAETALYREVNINDHYNESSRWTEGEWNDYYAKCKILDQVLEREKMERGYIGFHKPVLGRILDWIEWCKTHLEWESWCQLWSIPLATFSDYSGSQVERSNAAVLMERYPWLSQRSGGHGTEWLGISPPDLIDVPVESFSEFMNDVTSLDDYPLLDEEDHSAKELEAQEEAWRSWVENDFKRDISHMIENDSDLSEEEAEELVELFDNVEDNYLWMFFYNAADKANEYWEIETGGGAYIRIDAIVKALTTRDVRDFLKEVREDKEGKEEERQEEFAVVKEAFPKPKSPVWIH